MAKISARGWVVLIVLGGLLATYAIQSRIGAPSQAPKRLTIDDYGIVRNQLKDCRDEAFQGFEFADGRVFVKFDLDRHGDLVGEPTVELRKGIGKTPEFAEAAKRAVILCAPFDVTLELEEGAASKTFTVPVFLEVED